MMKMSLKVGNHCLRNPQRITRYRYYSCASWWWRIDFGIACAAKKINPTVKIIGVEPEGAASALACH